jgi:hypothetical protein
MDDARLRQLISEAGPLDDKIQEVVELQEDGAGWVIRFQHVNVRVENLPKFNKIGFSAVLDGPQEDHATAAFRAMLAANVMWRLNGGLRFGIGSSDNLVELSIELADVGVTARDIATYARGLAEHTATWALIFQGRVRVPEEGAVAPEFDADMIRI